MLVYIAGSGAMGCRFGYQISKTNNDVILLDNWEAHLQTIKENGLKISGDVEEIVKLPIMKPTEATKEADLIILFTKAMQLPQMLTDIKGIIGPETKVLCLLNGLGHEDVIRHYIPEHNILMGVTVWTASLEGPGQVHLQGVGALNLQSMDPANQEAGHQIADLLNDAQLNATYDDNVVPNIWRKACVNGTMNSTCALLDCTIGELFASEDGLNMVKEIIHEFVIVGRAEGVELNEEEITAYVMETSVKAAHHYPSMHQDLVQNHRLTEIDFINGAVNTKGEKLGIDTPYCRLITQLVHAKEDILKIK
ncbi:TPA: 2-dehydropantoate 2-reductase [Streptococcus equi subsp. zooepidemicus]|uniref:2-dehydropantoate 2-reductase n=1 Tax=Streptococcus equi TaxID=1336 RepID=UPI001E5A8820|nr:2-dehydropantoate 2-reductase [Streptococcus equi]MCD3387162.1 2-dehydropantoate 2-reductase [Streptococcus equi subsp. zooepidemicus]MCD3421748.1 2-dehydropantoate 2-reductase [Streptococcus equi subsp. zooepidemicus]MCD3435974.1 2-dehydropantoate 2-reductase [Streptococcus equi subsp. zooepidemicus]MCD3439488.1 2-dehydropantoate 2-reductase [Streptococcus equi subsp. zooepidemicus]MCD3459747.1 2-dehydropantoate 2-reductase [Streptococcus equi subsp. zooepidemicus]